MSRPLGERDPLSSPVLRVVRDPRIDVRSFLRPRLDGDVPFRELAMEYFEREKRLCRRTSSGLRTLELDLHNHLLPAFGDERVRGIDARWALALVDALSFQGLAGKTANKILSEASSIFEFGIVAGVVEHNPIRQIPRSERPSRDPRDTQRAALEVLSIEEMRRVLRSTILPFERRLLWTVLLCTGLRIGEAAALAYGDFSSIGPLSGELRVSRSWNSKQREVQPTKTGDPRRVPAIRQLASVVDEARAWLDRRWRREPTRHDLICRYLPPRSGLEHRFWNEATALKWWRKDLELLGIVHPASGPRRLHATRHTFVSQCLRLGARERALQPATHRTSSERSAFALYAHFDWSDLCNAVRVLEEALE